MKNHKSLLAKLMANEDIAVRIAKVKTASFNVKKRIITIPPWTDIEDATYDLLLGHEVGHALYTPAEGWHDAVHNHPFPKSYANILEDIRIEKSVQAKYPGLRRCFISGYRELLSRNFFGIAGKDVNTLSFMNRLNIKSKCRSLIDVSFTEEEMEYVYKAYNCKTFDDVIEVCNEIYEWLNKKNEANEPPPKFENKPEESTNEDEGENEYETYEEEKTASESEGPENNDDDEQEPEPTTDEDSGDYESCIDDDNKEEDDVDDDEDGITSDDSANEFDENFDHTDAETDDTFRDNEDALVDDGGKEELPSIIDLTDFNKIKRAIVSYKTVNAARKIKNHYSQGSYAYENTLSLFNEKLKESKQNAMSLVREFERRKSAWQLKRQTESKSGCLNMNKLTQYKFNDDLFLSKTNIPNGKSHGIVSIIDFSGSMREHIGTTIAQAYIFAHFAKKVNIPFKIMSFTSICYVEHDFELSDTDCNVNNVCLVEQFTSEMTLKEMEDVFKVLWISYSKERVDAGLSKYDMLGGTPLDTVLAMMIPYINNFKHTNNLQKVSFITITDGETNATLGCKGASIYNRGLTNVYYHGKKAARFGMTDYYSNGSRRNPCDQLLEFISGMGVDVIGYYLKSGALSTYDIEVENEDELKKVRSEFNKNGIYTLQNFKGYDKYSFLKIKQNIFNEDFFEDIDKDSSKSDINKAFKKSVKEKLFSRAFAIEFAENIA